MRITKIILVIFIFVVSRYFSYSLPIMAQTASDTEHKLRAIADAVLKNATFQFIDPKTDQHFVSPEQAVPDTKLILESPYTDWRYWNGVLNIAMIRFGELLHESAYIEFAIRNVAFSFNNYH